MSRQPLTQEFTTGGSSVGGFPSTVPLGNKWNLMEEGTLGKKVKAVQNFRKHGLRTFFVDVDWRNRIDQNDPSKVNFTVRMPEKVRSFSPNVKVFLSVFSYSFEATPAGDKFDQNIYIQLSTTQNEINPYILNVPDSQLTNVGFTLENDSYHIDNITEITEMTVSLNIADGGKIRPMTNTEAIAPDDYEIISFNMRLRFMVDIEIE